MASAIGRRRPFPALVVVSLLLLFCLYPGQAWMAHFLPRLAGLATIDPGLILLGAPFHLLFSIDLILVPTLFLLLYVVIVLVYSISRHQPIGRSILQRSAAVVSGVFFLVVSISVAALISYVLVDQLPARTQHSMSAIGIDADIHLPFLGYSTNSLHGNILSVVGLLVGVVLFINSVTRNPRSHRPARLTRDQRMTPYQRMLQEKRRSSSPPPSFIPDDHAPYIPELIDLPPAPDHIDPTPTPQYIDSSAAPENIHPTPALPRNKFLHCRAEPLQTLEPEAVNYRPLG